MFKHLSLLALSILIYTTPLEARAQASIYRFAPDPFLESQKIDEANQRLNAAIKDPEQVIKSWITLPTAPSPHKKKILKLTLREAILLALRYNPNLLNAELDRIIQRYQLRLAENAFEVQYALGASGSVQKNRYSGIGEDTSKTGIASPELSYLSPLGTKASVSIQNNVNNYANYTPVLNFSISQPLLRGFNPKANLAGLYNAKDAEKLNKINLKQSVIEQVTRVIGAYRNLVLSGNNLENQKRQQLDAQKSFEINEKKIDSGQLEPTANIQQSYQIESLNLMVLQAQNDFQTAALELIQSIGLDPEMNIAVPNDLAIDIKPLPKEAQAFDIALKHNSEYQSILLVIEADKRQLEVAKNQQLWQLDLGANIQSGTVNNVDVAYKGVQNIYNGQNINQTATLTLTVPLRDLNRRSELINAKIKLEKDNLNLIAAKRALKTQIKNTLHNLENLEKRYGLALKQVELAQSAYSIEKKKQEAGIASALDVNNTQNQLIQAQIGLMSAKVAYLNQRTALERLLGTTLEVWDIKLRFGL